MGKHFQDKLNSRASRGLFRSLALAGLLALAGAALFIPQAAWAQYSLSGGDGDDGDLGGADGAADSDSRTDLSDSSLTVSGGAGGAGGPSTNSNGGAGGAADLTVSNDLSSTGAADFTGGAGGAGADGNGGNGGNGGNTSLSVGNSFSAQGAVTFSGGAGGAGGNGGGISQDGGAGGGVTLSVNNSFSAQGLVTLSGGNAGAAGSWAIGGAGGQATLNGATADLHLVSGFSLSGGNGGAANSTSSQNGPDGGNASLSAKNLLLEADSTLTSGVKGADAGSQTGGAGGAASFVVAETMTILGAAGLTLTKYDGDLSFSASTLLINAETSAGATSDAVFTLLRGGSGTGDLTGSIEINTLILAGDADGGQTATFSQPDGSLSWINDFIPANQFYIPNIVVRGTGNSLDIPNFSAKTFSGGRGLQSLTFQLTGREVGQGPMLAVNPMDPSPFNDITGLADKLALVALNSLDNLAKGTDQIIFLRGNDYNNAVDELVDGDGKLSTATPRRYNATYGLTAYYFDLLINGMDLVGTYMGSATSGGGYKPYFEGFVGELLTLNNGGNAIARTVGKAAAMPYGDDWRIITTAEAQHLRVDTGSHIDIDTIALTIALARQSENSLGHLTFGAFFETGWGDYSTYNNLDLFGDVDGDGDTTFYGGGLFARQDFNNGFYVETSGRLGLVDYDFDIDDDRFHGASYDDDEMYWGAHLGLGYLWQISEQGLLEFYDKLFWTHVDSGETSTGNEDINYDSMDSLRNRLGARYTHTFTEQVQGYIGAAWEYEFDGEADGWVRTGGQSIPLSDNPDLKGSSGLGELGLAVQPAAETPLYIDLSVYGLIGTQEGVGGALSLKYTF